MIAVVIVSAGKGKRMGAKIPKQFLKIKDKEIFLYSVLFFQKMKEIDKIIVVAPERYLKRVRKILKKYNVSKGIVVKGGKERYQSVWKGLKYAKGSSIVLVHDGVRPIINRKIVRRIIKKTEKYGACIPVLPLEETLKMVMKGKVISTLPREFYALAQTPQGFRYEILMKAFKDIIKRGISITDESMALELTGKNVMVIPGEKKNIKITTSEDLRLAELYLQKS